MTEDTGRYKTPGELVQAAREARGQSLEDLAGETRIPRRMLQAIEQDDFASLSGPLYVRSFLKTLAAELDLDADLLLERYEGLTGESDAEPATPAEGTWETETRVRHVDGGQGRRLLIIVAAVVALAVVALVLLRGCGGGETGPSAEPRPVVTDTLDTISELPADDAADDGAAIDEDAAPDPDERIVAPPAEVLDALAALPAGGPELEFADGRSYPLVLRLVLDRPLEVAVTADGDSVALAWDDPGTGVPAEGVRSGRPYRVGSRHVIYVGARDHFMLRLGAAEGVAVTLNDRVLEIPTRIVGHDWWLDRARLQPE
ncbi:MAG TPA: helix-turn-helix domain-containing protein [Candidatus Krumholzibacteria bacterium]|nr:helix-turn-helix domain-containing protein [Candidatus Krumholzibacteria bacterium]HRX51686.1 helix-turn-helix domain-containing protein [Candidatus Krumholzibacteria bacterium]